MIKIIRSFSVFSLGLILLLPMSRPTLALPRTDFYGPGDSGAYYDFYLDWMYPKKDVKSTPRVIEKYDALYKKTEDIRRKWNLGQTATSSEETSKGAEAKAVSK